MTTIYLSSTYEDLKDYREVVYKALRQSGYNVIAMEDYVAADRRPVEKCLKDVEKADIYIGLFAFRYGYVPPEEHNNPNGLSITELEFRHAQESTKPCLLFIAKEDAGIPLMFVDAYTGEGKKGELIGNLRQYALREKTGSLFSLPHQLASLVQAAVANHLSESDKGKGRSAKEPAPSVQPSWDIEKNGSPYPGLMHFTRKYAPVFFGREAEVGEILDRMRIPEGRFIIISGDSGVGKSSVVDAGILPRLETDGLPGNDSAECVRMLPGQGNQPFGALMTALGSLATRAGLRPDDIAKELTKLPDTLGQNIKKIISGGSDRHAFVLFLDQMEELFTAQDIEQSNKFLTALYQAAQEKALWVLATIRGDHLHYCHGHAEMLQVLRGKGHYPLGPVEPFIMSDMIVKPAHCAGFTVSDTLARRIVNDAGSGSANLPLLAFVLDQLFKQRSDQKLSDDAYNTLGGVGGAIAQHAKNVEEIVRRELDTKASNLLSKLFQSLVNVNPEGLPTRKRPRFVEFSSELRQLANVLVRERLLHTEGEGESATVSISHEKLFEAWPALRDFVAANKKQLMDQTLFQSRARKWQEMGRPWFGGLASRREYNEFLKSGVVDGQTYQYVSASKRAWWSRTATSAFLALVLAFLALVFLFIAKARNDGLSVEHTVLKLKSTFTQIHIEPVVETVDGGSFRMGDVGGLGDKDERPVRDVRIKKFAIGRFEVTFDEFDRFAVAKGRSLPSDQGWGRGRRPVINVSWEDARAYSVWLSEQTGKRYRLPSEAEWEYAARSGGMDEVWSGTSREQELGEFAWYGKNSGGKTQPVGTSKKANGLKLHDMIGNVWEWVEDCWHDNYYGAPADGRAWKEETGGQCGRRVIRGGAWTSGPGHLRASSRYRYTAGDRADNIGFRLAQDLN
jgi:formylglycine-generating enzyme required for sulfatase activity